MQSLSDGARSDGRRISLVPTMGALHEGHINLISEARKMGDVLVVTIFVNPTQFGPHEDFTKYPRDLEGDLRKIEGLGVDFVFAPTPEEMYPEGFQTYVEVKELQEHLCGRFRPGHFRGVATVVLKLFNIVKPHVALFGEKDYQQLKTIERMVQDLNFPIEIVPVATVREPDGLAMSSRNAYLTPDQRQQALALHGSLRAAEAAFKSGVRDPQQLVSVASAWLQKTPEVQLEYIETADAKTLEQVTHIDRPVVLAIAARVGSTRLIDNLVLVP